MELITILEILWRRKWLVLGAGILTVLGVVAGAMLIVPTYTATSRVQVGTSDTLSTLMAGLGLETKRQSGSITLASNYDTEIIQAQLYPILLETIQKLNLKDRWRKKPLPPDDLVDSSLLNYFIPRPYVDVTEYNSSSILEIAASSRNPEEAANIGNMIADLFIQDRIRKRSKEFSAIREYIDEQTEQAKAGYIKSLADIQDFMAKTGMLSRNNDAQRLSVLQSNLSDLVVSLAKKGEDFSPEHPEYKLIEAQIEAVKKLISTEVETQAANGAEYEKLDSASSIAKTVYEQFLTYRIQVGAAERLALSAIRLEQSAPIPTDKSFPKKLLVSVVAILLGSFAAFGAGFTIDYIDHSMKGPGELQEHPCSVPLLGTIPRVRVLKRGGAVISDSKLPVYEAFRGVRDTVEGLSKNGELKVLAVTSSLAGEGKSIVAANLAVVLAARGLRVILVDMNLRKPRVAGIFGVPESQGLSSVLDRDAPLTGSIVHTGISGLDLLPCGAVPDNPAGLLDAKRPKLKSILAELARSYDRVIVDTPPVAPVKDALVACECVDGVIVVAELLRVSQVMIEDTCRTLSDAHARPVGVVLNGARMQLFGYRSRKYR